ncbi:MAG: hypothetical protein V1799_07600 [bacterium]
MTSLSEIKVKEVLSEGLVVAVYRNKRTPLRMNLFAENDRLVFEGWDLPVSTDMKSFSTFRGNACLNLVGDPEVIRDFIDNRNLNPRFSRKDIVLLIPGPDCGNEIPLYPEVETYHAVVQRIRQRVYDTVVQKMRERTNVAEAV